MKRFVLSIACLALLVAVGTTAALRAQTPPPPTPPPDPHAYIDPGMNFTAPADAMELNRVIVPLSELSQDLQPVAAWALHPGKEDMRIIKLEMESFLGAPSQWEGQFESQTHGAGEGVLIRKKVSMALLNGMPASFVEVTYGSGFDSRKEFAVVWADGQRGIVLSYTSRTGDATAEEAKAALSNVTAVRYPMNQP